MWSMVKMQEARSKHASTEMDLRVKVRKGMWEAKQARKTLIQTLYWKHGIVAKKLHPHLPTSKPR